LIFPVGLFATWFSNVLYSNNIVMIIICKSLDYLIYSSKIFFYLTVTHIINSIFASEIWIFRNNN
jgi:hypothetical protein